MAFCKNCGAQVDGQFCPKCGTPAAAPAGAATPPPPQPQYAQPSAGYTAAPQPAAAAGGMTDNVAGLLCYVLGLITGVLFLVLEPYNKNKFVRFHAFQSIFFNLAWIALWIVITIVGTILVTVTHLFWFLISLLHLVVWLAGLVIWILLLMKAYQGQKWQLPIIGPLAEKQA